MMENSYQSAAAAPRPRPVRRFLLILLCGLIAGIALMLWGLSQSPTMRAYLFGDQEAKADATPLTSVSPRVGLVGAPPSPPQLASVDARIAALEMRIEQLNRAAAGGIGSAGRAEGLLLAFAARRALDRGMALGYVEGQISNHFGASQPRAVSMIIAAARQPVTLDQLKIELDELAPTLSGNRADESWWNAIGRSVSGLFIVRQADTPSTSPAERVNRAREAIGLGRVDQALAEVARLPNRELATAWMNKARRHVEAYRALDLLEAAAIVGPVQLPPTPTIILPDPAPTRPEEPSTSGDKTVTESL
jgi:hypothetical protein